MAHSNPDFVIDRNDHETFLSREDEWFRANCSRSATPQSQLSEITRPRGRILYTNAPLRSGPTEMQLAVEAAHKLIFPTIKKPDYSSARKSIKALVLPPITKIAMHGGAGVGERFSPPKRRQLPIKFSTPDFCLERNPSRGAAPPKMTVRSNGHAIAGAAVKRGLEEKASLDALRAASAARKSK